MKDIKTIAAECDVNVSGNTVKCEKKEGQEKDLWAQLKDKFYKKKYDRIGSLDTVAAGLADADEAQRDELVEELAAIKTLRGILGAEFADSFVKLKLDEWNQYMQHFSEWERQNALDV